LGQVALSHFIVAVVCRSEIAALTGGALVSVMLVPSFAAVGGRSRPPKDRWRERATSM
jgi:hypothetical protein